ncbi:MAG: alanine--glyoxylate aminotransferase family protein [Caldisericia bacterium]|jgi:aspartate aminotransferase-like enzyme|nr:alanine--glyoxylate aminotransferase family protein [Caldisericia bacterium]
MRELLLIPGPTPVNEEVLKEISRQPISHMSKDFGEYLKKCVEYLKVIFGTKNGNIFIIPGSGTLGMEIAIKNFLAKEEKALVISHGFFGDRFLDILEEDSFSYDKIQSKWGEVIDLNIIYEKLKKEHFSLITITHVDTSTGILAPIEDYMKVIKDVSYDSLVVLDGVCATAGVEEKMDEWGIDIILTGSQKALAVPPGLTILAVSERAMKKRENLGKIGFYYGDLLRWKPTIEDATKYFATHNTNYTFGLKKSLEIILSEGLDNRYKRHYENASFIRELMKEIGFEVFGNRSHLAPTLSLFIYPNGIEDEKFRSDLKSKGITVAAGIKELKGKVFRMGHMGEVRKEDLQYAFEVIKEVVKK